MSDTPEQIARKKADDLIAEACLDVHQYENGTVTALKNAITSALLQASQGKWETMESAPKDGTPILVYGRPYGEIHGSFADLQSAVAASTGGPWNVMATDAYCVTIDDPIAWRPLPSPPEDA